jgi:hypothetical protein
MELDSAQKNYLPARMLAKALKILGCKEWSAISSLSIAFPKLAHTTVAYKDLEAYPNPLPQHYRL